MKKNPNKTRYRIRNWSEYSTALENRGSLTVWFEEDVLKQWLAPPPSGKRGRPHLYHDLVIITALTFSALFRLPLRQTHGLVASILKLMGITLPTPDSSTLSRRRKNLHIPLRARKSQTNEPIHVVVDSTGLKVYGEGEWKVRQHGYSKRRTWRKMHLAVDEKTGEILAEELTGNDVHDGQMLMPLVKKIDVPFDRISGDGAYDYHGSYDKLGRCGVRAIIPPRRGARIKKHGNRNGEKFARDEIVRRIRKVGRKQWKKESGYHRRSLAETMMFRQKTIFGDKLSARIFESQRIEASIRCRAMNQITALGMPDTYRAV